ncbi:MAG TPA: OmpA family protein [Polyangiaceae bacterium]|nr:OmpA family protein [Polyangiaceae bacterium]
MSSIASAQAGYFYLDRAQLSGAPDDGFTVFRPYVPRKNRFYATAAFGYTLNPLRSETVTRNSKIEEQIDNPMQGQLIAYASAGVQVLSRVGVSLTLPILLRGFPGDDPQVYGVGAGGIGDVNTAVHDLRIDLRVRTYETDDGVARFGGGVAMFAPTGNGAAFASDDQVTGWVFGSAEFDLGDLLLAGHIGPHFRPERSIGGQYGGLYLASEMRFAFGAYVPLRQGRIRLGGELFGGTGLESGLGPRNANTIFSQRNTDVEWLGQARFLIERDQQIYVNAGFGTRLSTGYGAPDMRVLASIGRYFEWFDSNANSPKPKRRVQPTAAHYDLDTDKDGFPDAIDACPTIKEDGKEPDPTDGCPGTSDRDGDGIPDSTDVCPDKPEDKDGIQDDDGCPEEDADNDTIPDVQDKCPLEPGTRSADPERFGCPTLTRLDDTGSIVLLKPIEFEFGRAVIKAESFPILDEVLTLMKARPELRVGVYGHTDNRGGDALNLRLSKERAAACVTYLTEHGISADRLESEGFGRTQPVADNATDEGRARNRRVDFKVLSE